MDGLGTELGICSTLLILAKIGRDIYVEWSQKKKAVKVANGNPGNPAPPANPGGSSSNIVLHLLNEHGVKLRELGNEMTRVQVNLGKVNQKLDIQ